MRKYLHLILAVFFLLGTVGISIAADQQAPAAQQPTQPAPAAQQPAVQQPAQPPATQQPAVKEQAPPKPSAPEVKPVAPAQKEEKAPAKKTEAPAKGTKKAEAAKAAPPVNINTASEKELQKLPGIGKVLSKRIVEYRTQHGPFASPEDLMKVKGITKKKFEAIKNHIAVQ